MLAFSALNCNLTMRLCFEFIFFFFLFQDPIPDYISSAVKRDSLAQPSPPPFSELIPGRFYAAKLHPDSNWDRVQLLGPSAIDADCFRVYAVDIGSFGIVRKSNIRHLKIPNGLRKILMAKCKVSDFFDFLFE